MSVAPVAIRLGTAHQRARLSMDLRSTLSLVLSIRACAVSKRMRLHSSAASSTSSFGAIASLLTLRPILMDSMPNVAQSVYPMWMWKHFASTEMLGQCRNVTAGDTWHQRLLRRCKHLRLPTLRFLRTSSYVWRHRSKTTRSLCWPTTLQLGDVRSSHLALTYRRASTSPCSLLAVLSVADLSQSCIHAPRSSTTAAILPASASSAKTWSSSSKCYATSLWAKRSPYPTLTRIDHGARDVRTSSPPITSTAHAFVARRRQRPDPSSTPTRGV